MDGLAPIEDVIEERGRKYYHSIQSAYYILNANTKNISAYFTSKIIPFPFFYFERNNIWYKNASSASILITTNNLIRCVAFFLSFFLSFFFLSLVLLSK